MRNTIWASIFLSALIVGVVFINFDEDRFMATMIQSGFMGESAEISESEFQEAFTDFLATYKKSYYNSYEFENRYLIFKDNYQMVSDHNLNADNIGFTMKINQFGDLTSQEFKDKYLGLNLPKPFHKGHKKSHTKSQPKKEFTLESLFERKETVVAEDFKDFNWADEGKVHSVKNQGSCGSCWAFSAIGAIESGVAITKGLDTVPDLSEQQLVDCTRDLGNEGCNGGWMDYGFQYAETTKVCSEKEYAYHAKDESCKIDSGDVECAEGVLIKDFVDVEVNSKAALKAALDNHPVSVAVDATIWQFYFGGIIRFLCSHNLNHGVLATGYGHGGSKLLKSTDYWVIKNSWGPSWGLKGYVHVKADETKNGGTCGVLASASYPIIEA
mmetsp:Transcript_244/g.236  ORF Transcript_244/g.236 Transcript_244/m.236 type:complete len:384 (+) Transcript_244:3-1154(+)